MSNRQNSSEGYNWIWVVMACVAAALFLFVGPQALKTRFSGNTTQHTVEQTLCKDFPGFC